MLSCKESVSKASFGQRELNYGRSVRASAGFVALAPYKSQTNQTHYQTSRSKGGQPSSNLALRRLCYGNDTTRNARTFNQEKWFYRRREGRTGCARSLAGIGCPPRNDRTIEPNEQTIEGTCGAIVRTGHQARCRAKIISHSIMLLNAGRCRGLME